MAALLSRRVSGSFVVLVLSVALLSGVGAPATATDIPAGEARAGGTSHKSPTMIDISTPYFKGYNKKLKAYRFDIYGRWNPKCGGKYCWPGPCVSSCDHLDIGSDDAVRIRFSDSVSFKQMKITTNGVCGDVYYSKTGKFSTGSFDDAYAGVNDEVVTSWVYTWYGGGTVIDRGYCKKDTLPTSSGVAGGGGGSGGFRHYGDLKGRAFKYTVWVNPLPSRGRCYDRLYVKAGYTHTWTDESITWGLGYPWGIGVGTTTTDGSFTVWQDNDGVRHPQLRTPRMCKH